MKPGMYFLALTAADFIDPISGFSFKAAAGCQKN